MGFAVLHIQKPKGNDSGTTAHIERTVSPANADIERTPLNQNLIRYPDGVETRTQAIQHRIENAGIKRKISHNQVRALQVMLSGTPEDMRRIQAAGKLDEWCRDNIDWLRETFGEDNVVSAVLHLDEKTPHIHATVVPIVTGESYYVCFGCSSGRVLPPLAAGRSPSDEYLVTEKKKSVIKR